MGLRVAAAVIVVLLAAGCFRPDSLKVDAGPLLLKDFAECRSRYGDDRPAACTNEFTGVQQLVDLPDGYVCVAEQGGPNPTWRVFREATPSIVPGSYDLGTSLAIFLDSSRGVPRDFAGAKFFGALRFTTGGKTVFLNWSDAKASGYFLIEGLEADATGGFYADSYAWTYNLSTSPPRDWTLSPIWSQERPDVFWIVLAFSAQHETYFFEHMNRGQTFSYISDFGLRGGDFDLSFGNAALIRGGATDNNLLLTDAGCAG